MSQMNATNKYGLVCGKGRRSGLTAVVLVVSMGVASACVHAVDRQPKGTPKSLSRHEVTGKPVAPKPVEPQRQPVKPEDVKGPRPVIHAEESTHDFGTVWVGPIMNHSFTIKNTGDAVLEITRVKPSCGCTIAGQYPRTLEPGASGQFPFAINTQKLHSRFSKSISISSNDPVTPEIRLVLRGEVKQYVDITPNHANFGRLLGDEPQERVLNIQNNTDKPLELTMAKESDGGFDFELITKEPGQKYELRVTAKPPFEAGMMKGDANFTTNIDEQKTLSVVARATVPERLDVQPKSITISSRSATDRGMSRVIRLTNYGNTDVKVTDVSSDDPAIKLTLNERTPGKAYTVLVELPPNYEPPATGRNITLKTTDSKSPTIQVPVLAPYKARQEAARKPTRPAEQLVGRPAPRFNTTTVEGKPLNNDTLKDAVTVLDFYAVNCGFCTKQIPRLETVRKDYADKDVRFVAVSQTMRTPYSEADTQAKLSQLGFNGEFVYDPDNKLGPEFEARSFPTMVVLGKSGKIEAVNVGNIGDLESRLKTQIDALLAGKPIPQNALPTAQAQPPKRATPEELVDKAAPSFALETIDGKRLSNTDLASAPATVLNFFAPNCGFCKKQMPRLEEVRKKYADKGVRVVNVSQQMRKAYPVDEVMEIVKGTGYEGEVAINHDNSVGGKFNVSGFPTMVVLGKDGKVKAVNVGNVADLETRLPGQLDALIAGKAIPDQFATKPRAAQPTRRPAEEMVGKKAPDFTITTLDGKAVSSDEFSKRPATVLNFVAPNCGFCKRQIPNIEKIREKYEAKGVRFVNVSETMRKEYSAEETKQVFDGVGSKLELAKDDGNKVGQMYKAVSFPTMVVVGKDGKVAHVNVGAKPNIDSLLSTQLDGLINGSGGTN